MSETRCASTTYLKERGLLQCDREKGHSDNHDCQPDPTQAFTWTATSEDSGEAMTETDGVATVAARAIETADHDQRQREAARQADWGAGWYGRGGTLP